MSQAEFDKALERSRRALADGALILAMRWLNRAWAVHQEMKADRT